MDIRALHPIKDRQIVGAVFATAADYVTLETGAAPDDKTVVEFFDERPPSVGPDDALHFGLFEDDNPMGLLGICFGYPEPTDCYIGLLLLCKDARGLGFGPKALAHATNVARARGMKRQLVAVLDENPKGRAFWNREGFVLDQTFAPTDDRHTRHRLIRAI